MTKTQELTAADRCDACGAQAVISFKMKTAETPLMMCGHHTLKNKESIRVSAELVWNADGELIVDRQELVVR